MQDKSWAGIRHFEPREFACKCGCGKNETKPELARLVDDLRESLNLPLKINSAYRCPRHNKTVGGVNGSAHVLGLAADIACLDSSLKNRIVSYLQARGIKRIGHYRSFIHVDLCKDKPQTSWRG